MPGLSHSSRTINAIGLAAVVAFTAACGTTGVDAPSATGHVAAEPAQAPPLTTPAIGRVVPIGNEPEGVVVGASGVAVVAVRRPDALVFAEAATGQIRQTVATTGAARHLELAGPDGPVIAGLETADTVAQFGLDGRELSGVSGVGDLPHDSVRTSDGTIVVTNEHGGGVVFLRNGVVAGQLPAGPVQPGGAAAVGPYAVVADVQGHGIFVYDGAAEKEVATKGIGVRLTHVAATENDQVAVADTDGGEVLIEQIGPDITDVARVPAPGKPYGLAYDAARHRLYVTLTASNLLRVVDLTDVANPRILADLPTARQPNSVAVDPKSGSVLVTAGGQGAESGLQIISEDLLPS